MPPVHLPPIEAVIDLHRELVQEFGGVEGLRDRGGLEAALARPRQIVAYEGAEAESVARLAVAAASAILRRHPFVDGNKRAAFAVLGVVLGLNGLYLDSAEGDATRMVIALAGGEIDEERFLEWVNAATVASPETPQSDMED